jgi:hypothetical protein
MQVITLTKTQVKNKNKEVNADVSIIVTFENS